VNTAKNGLLNRLQRRLIVADRNGALFEPPPSWPKSWLARSKPASRARTLQRAHFRLFGFSEDRIVKQFMAAHSRAVYDRRAPFAEPQPMRLADAQRVMPSAAEVAGNPRSRSAVMRVATRTDVPAEVTT